MPNETEFEIQSILQNDRLKATGKLEAIADVLYGADREDLEDFEDEESRLDEDEDIEEM